MIIINLNHIAQAPNHLHDLAHSIMDLVHLLHSIIYFASPILKIIMNNAIRQLRGIIHCARPVVKSAISKIGKLIYLNL